MYENRMEYICALLCLLSSLNRCPADPPAMPRSTVRKMIECGALDGLVLRDTGGFEPGEYERARALLSRASIVYRSIMRYQEKGIEVLLPNDELWPQKLNKLGDQMPLYLFAVGNTKLLRERTISVAGSRAIRWETKECAARIGRVLAAQRLTVVSGGAQGVDMTVQNAVLSGGGKMIIVPAVPAALLMKDALLRAALEEGRALVLYETPPEEGFSAQKALTRNHTIYALGQCAVVIASRAGRGGSWSGAQACIKGKWSPVFVLDEDGIDFQGNAALIQAGAYRMQLVAGEKGDELLLQGLDLDGGYIHSCRQISLFE